jgi:hypothetical protein
MSEILQVSFSELASVLEAEVKYEAARASYPELAKGESETTEANETR